MGAAPGLVPVGPNSTSASGAWVSCVPVRGPGEVRAAAGAAGLASRVRSSLRARGWVELTHGRGAPARRELVSMSKFCPQDARG